MSLIVPTVGREFKVLHLMQQNLEETSIKATRASRKTLCEQTKTVQPGINKVLRSIHPSVIDIYTTVKRLNSDDKAIRKMSVKLLLGLANFSARS